MSEALELIRTPRLETSLEDCLRLYRESQERKTFAVVTFDFPTTTRDWEEAMNPSIWKEIMKFELDRKYGGSSSSPMKSAASSLMEKKTPSNQQRRPKSIAFGGSFDGCHQGHLAMLWYCLKFLDLESSGACKLYLGITPQHWVSRKSHGELAYSLETRVKILRDCVIMLLRSMNFSSSSRSITASSSPLHHKGVNCLHQSWHSSEDCESSLLLHISELDDLGVGIAGVCEDITHLIITPECLKGASIVNEVRRKNGFEDLILEECSLMMVCSEKKKVSSTKIRENSDC